GLVVGGIVTLAGTVKALTGSWAAAFASIAPPIGGLIQAWGTLKSAVEPHLGLARDLASIVRSPLIIARDELKRSLEPVIEKFKELVGTARLVVFSITNEIVPAIRGLGAEIKATLFQALPGGFRELAAGIGFVASKLPGFKGDIHETAVSL